MRPILAAEGRGRLSAFARDRTLVALDFDGTLAPIQKSASAAVMRRKTTRLLTELARRYPCVIVTGRSRRDVALRVHRAAVDIVGNHGAEPASHDSAAIRTIARARRHLAPIVQTMPGAWLEDKFYSLALHYRGVPRPHQIRAKLRRAARQLEDIRVIGGKQVLNIVATSAPHKGAAVERARRARRCDAVIYVGDDETDEDVFRSDRSAPLLGIRVGRTPRTGAPFHLRDQGDIDLLLAALVRLRPLDSGDRHVMAESTAEEGLGATLEFMRLLWGLDHALQKRSKWMANRLGVTGPQRLALRIVGHTPQISAGRLAATLKVHPSTLTGVLQRLERDKLLTRALDRADRRRQRLELTPRGRRVMSSSRGSIERSVAGVLRRSSARDLQTTARVLRSLVAAIESDIR